MNKSLCCDRPVKQCLKNRNYGFKSNNEKNIRGKLRRQNFVFLFLGRFFVFLPSCCTLIVALAIVGNLVVCYVIMVDRNLRNNPMMLLLLSWAISVLVTLTVVAPLDIEVFFLRGACACPGGWGTSLQDLYHNIRYLSTLLYLDPYPYLLVLSASRTSAIL